MPTYRNISNGVELGGATGAMAPLVFFGLKILETRALAGNLKLGGLEIFFQRVTGGDFLKITVYKKW